MNAPHDITHIQPKRRHTLFQRLNPESQCCGVSVLHLSTWASSHDLFQLAEMRQNAALGMLTVVSVSSVDATTSIDAANIAVPAAFLISDAQSLYQAAVNELIRETTYFGVLDVKAIVREHRTPQDAAESIGVTINRLEDWCAEGITRDNITQSEAARLMRELDAIDASACDIVVAVAKGAKGVAN